jgi:RimJ/RimL family protein N-acetyltransferase
MLANQTKTYRNLVTLKDGANVLLRPLDVGDNKQIQELFEAASGEDTRYLRDNVKDPKVVAKWFEDLDYSKTLPLVAVVRERIVGQATLHFRKGPERHIGEVRIFLAKDFRKRGLGTKMINTLIELARRENLYLLTAEVVTNQPQVIKAFQKMGFELCCTFEDYFMLPDGDLCDVAILMMHLTTDINEF